MNMDAIMKAQPVGSLSFDEFREKAAEFHGYPAPGLLLGGYMVEHAKSLLPEGILFEVVVESAKCLPDAVQLLTLCTYGNGRIRLANTGRYALALYDKHTGEGWRVYVDTQKLEAWPELAAWLLKRKAKKDQDSELLFAEIAAAGASILSKEPIRMRPRFMGHKHGGPIAICPSCGESYPKSAGPICHGCLGEVPYEKTEVHSPRNEATLRAVPLEEAVGRTALHDMTRIAPGEFKGAAFKAGQTITAGDVCELQRMGKAHVFLEDETPITEEFVHENDAALAFAKRMAGEGILSSETPREGKVDFVPTRDGLFVVDETRLRAFNLIPGVMCATRQNNLYVEKGRPVAGSRAIPLFLPQGDFARALAVLGTEPIFSVQKLNPLRTGILVTGTEVFQGLIEDRFIPVISGKVENFGCPVVATDIVPDDRLAIAEAVEKQLASGAELVVTTAGLSVDPDDVTRLGLQDAGLTDMLYGAPILPGAMTLLGRIGDVRVMGVPACGVFHKTTSFDLLLPRVLAGQEITRHDLAEMAAGGFCLNCDVCTFPKCPFGK